MKNQIVTIGTIHSRWITAIAMFSVVIAACLCRASLATDTPASQTKAGISPEQQKRIELMKSNGPKASLTILPVRLAGQPSDRVAEVVGLLLERQGLQNIETGKTAFGNTNRTGMESLVISLEEFLRKHPVATDYALYAEYNGSPRTGLEEIRAIVVDKTGALVWTDRLTPQDEAFKNLEDRDPMGASVLLAERLGPQLGLNEMTAKAAKPGKMAALMDARSGMPPQNERAPLPERQKLMKQSKPKATLVIFPARVHGDEADAASAANLAKMINDAGLCQASAANQSVVLKASQADPNELKTLWGLAREFRDHVKRNPVDADYTLYADYIFNPAKWEQGFVHFVVCNRQGEWVIVDMQNSHHPDYQSIKPKSRLDCDKILVKRLEGYLR
jgi:hypothetical protein